MSRNYLQGHFEPNNPNKCLNTGKVTYRSSYELHMMRYLDNNPNVIKWGSENVVVPYMSSVKGRMARYFVDMVMTYVDKNGTERTVLVEIKPSNQVKKPIKGKNQKQSTYEEQVLTYITNLQKWEAASKFAAERGWEFKIITENELFR